MEWPLLAQSSRSPNPISRAISEAGGRGARSLFSDRHELSLVLTVAHGLALLLPLWLKLILGVSNLSKWLARSIGYPWQSRSAVEVGRYVVLSVRDTGEGMDAETLTRAIEPFFSTKGVGKGTELGLSMVFGLAQQSGGALRLESAPLSGTTARLWLPVASETAHPSGQTRNIVTQASGPAKILFVDDDLPIAGSTVDLPEDLGHQVIEVHSAIEALRLLDGGLAADLLITDHAMPGMTGIELAREVRRQYPQLPILLATGFAELEGSEVVDVARLAKPYTQLNLRRR